MRKFWMQRGDKIWDMTTDLSQVSKGNFLADPEGLGVKTKIDSYEVEFTSFVESVKLESPDISGKLYFKDYEHFSRFASFIGIVETSNPLRLYYSVDGISYNNKLDPQWYKLVLIKELSKGEIDTKTGALICSVKFAALSRWKKDKSITLELSRFGGALVYPFFYPYIYGGKSNMAVEIDNTDNLPTSCIVRVEAEADTPVFRILKDGTVLDQAKYNVYIRAGSTMVIDSAADKQEASIYTKLADDSFHREDIYYLGEKDYTFSNFITIPEGKSLFLFTASNSDFGKVTLEYSIQRELV